jgi:hypothetical protein
MVDFIGLDIIDDLDQIARRGDISIYQVQVDAILGMRVAVDVVNAAGIEGARPPDKPVYLITFR